MRLRHLMRQLPGLLVVAVVPGCDQVLGIHETVPFDAAPDADLRPDLDKDGIPDVLDPCIAAADDFTDDIDDDGIPSGTDPCPFNGPDVDTDGDGIDNVCDPFPNLAGDHYRCVMRFSSAALSAALWQPRAGEKEFAIARGYFIGFDTASVVAVEPVLPASKTIVADVAMGQLGAGMVFRVWVLAGPTPSSADVSCDLGVDLSSGTVLSASGATGVVPAAGPKPTPDAGYFLRVMYQPGAAGNNLVCAVQYDATFMFAPGHVSATQGNFGFAVATGGAAVVAVAIYDRDDAPALP